MDPQGLSFLCPPAKEQVKNKPIDIQFDKSRDFVHYHIT